MTVIQIYLLLIAAGLITLFTAKLIIDHLYKKRNRIAEFSNSNIKLCVRISEVSAISLDKTAGKINIYTQSGHYAISNSECENIYRDLEAQIKED